MDESRKIIENIIAQSNALIFAFTDPNFEIRQRENEEILANCPSVEWVADMGKTIPFCRKTGNFCNYCR